MALSKKNHNIKHRENPNAKFDIDKFFYKEGDEKLDMMIQSMTDYIMSLTTTIGSMPNYVNFIRKPKDASKTPEQNEIDHETVINALKNLEDNTELMNKMYNYFTKYIGDKYKFKV